MRRLWRRWPDTLFAVVFFVTVASLVLVIHLWYDAWIVILVLWAVWFIVSGVRADRKRQRQLDEEVDTAEKARAAWRRR